MLRPNKYTNLEISVFTVAGEIFRLLKLGKALKYDYVHNVIVNSMGISTKGVFIESLSFLFLTQKVLYIKESDTLVYETQ